MYSFFNFGAVWVWVFKATARPLYPGKEGVPIVQGVGWAPGPVWRGAENLAHTGIRSPDSPALSESLHRLSYPGPQNSTSKNKIRIHAFWI